MRRLFILLAALAHTFFSSGYALSTAVDTEITSDTSLLNVNIGHKHRFLREVSDNDEERLSGANMFNAEKIKQAVGDTTYAKRLYQRWKRNGFEEKAVYDTLWKQHRLGTDNQVYKLYQNYVTWLDLHHPLNVDLGAKNMFASEKLTKAAENPAYANVLFGRWKRRGFTMINVRDQFKRMKITSEQPLYSVYNNYLAWLRIHYPKGDQPKTTDIAFLFNRDRINRAQKDAEFEIKLFAKWKSADFDENGVYNKLLTMSSSRKRVDDDLYAVYVRYLNWLEVNHPLPPLRNRRS